MDTENTKEMMIKEWGLQNLPEETRDSFIERIGKLLYQAIILRAVDEMPEQDKKMLDTFMRTHAEADAASILDFLSTRIPNFAQLVTEENAKLKELLAPPVAA